MSFDEQYRAFSFFFFFSLVCHTLARFANKGSFGYVLVPVTNCETMYVLIDLGWEADMRHDVVPIELIESIEPVGPTEPIEPAGSAKRQLGACCEWKQRCCNWDDSHVKTCNGATCSAETCSCQEHSPHGS